MIYKILHDELRATTKTRYRIAKETGVGEAILCRLFHHQTGISVKHVETLLDFFGYEIVKRKAKK
jgi:hypothetical protein